MRAAALHTIGGQTKSIQGWADHYGISASSIRHKMLYKKMTLEQAIESTTKPVGFTHDGKTMPLASWARIYGIKPVTLAHRINYQGMTLAQALAIGTRDMRTRKQQTLARRKLADNLLALVESKAETNPAFQRLLDAALSLVKE